MKQHTLKIIFYLNTIESYGIFNIYKIKLIMSKLYTSSRTYNYNY